MQIDWGIIEIHTPKLIPNILRGGMKKIQESIAKIKGMNKPYKLTDKNIKYFNNNNIYVQV